MGMTPLVMVGLGLLEELGRYLQTAGLGVLGTDLFLGTLPDDPAMVAPVTALYETPGFPAAYVHSKAAPDIEQPVVQILVRGAPNDYAMARSHAEQVYLCLGSISNQTLDGTFYLWVMPIQDLYPLDTDDYGRPVVTSQFRCAKSVWEP